MAKTMNPNTHAVAYWYFRDMWIDALNLYEPLPTTLPLYLKKYEKEDKEEFASRARSLAQVNILYLVIEATISMLFSTNIDIKCDKFQEEIFDFVDNCNQHGDTLIEFAREQIAPSSFVYGSSDIVIDMPEKGQDVLTIDRQKAFGIKPYCYIIPPLNRPNWRINNFGDYTEYFSQDILNTQIQGNLQLNSSPESKKEYTHWTLDKVSKYDSNGQFVDDKKNPYGFIPIITCMPVAKSMRYPNERIGRSLVQDIIPLQKLILNVMSLIYDFHENVNFPERIWKQDTENGEEPPTEGELSEGGNKRGKIMRGKDSDYFLVEPDVKGVESMVCYLNQLIERCYQTLSMPSDANINKTHQTGDTIRSNQAVLFNRLSVYCKNFCKTIKEIIEMMLRVIGKSEEEIVDAKICIDWSTNFSYESFVNALEQLSVLKQTMADMCPLAVAEFAKKTLAPQFYGSDSHIMNDIEQKLDDWVQDTNLLLASQEIPDGDEDNIGSDDPEGPIDFNQYTIDRSQNVPLVAGASTDVNTIYIDKSIPENVAGVDTGKSLITHEITEQRYMNQGLSYNDAHIKATAAEKKYVESQGASWVDYQSAFNNYDKICEQEMVQLPPDIDLRPYDATNVDKNGEPIPDKRNPNTPQTNPMNLRQLQTQRQAANQLSDEVEGG